ncbi:MAG: hypothetical protein ACYDHH_26855 [Solirubrobacteraceae bacterium]
MPDFRRPSKPRRGHAVPAACTLIAILVALGGCGSSTPKKKPPKKPAAVVVPVPPAKPAKAPPPRTLQTIIEDELLLRTDPAAALTQFKNLGASIVRVYVAWNAFAPAPTAATAPAGFVGDQPSEYPPTAWATLDQIVQQAKAHGITVDFTVGGAAPAWAQGPGEPPNSPIGPWMPSPQMFGAFIHALGVRYGGHYTPSGASAPLPRVGFWSIWNEPNYGVDLAPQATHHSTVEVSPKLYRGLLDAAWSSLAATGHRRDTILIGETAPRGITVGDQPGNFSGMVPLRFLRALYCVGPTLAPLQGIAAAERGCPATTAAAASFRAQHPALFEATGWAAHLYPQGILAPNFKTPGEPDYADLASLPELEHTLDATQAAYGSTRKLPIYSTEFGYQTSPPEAAHLDPVTAAGYLNWSEYISWLDPRVKTYDQYLLRDPVTASLTSGFATGLEFGSGAPKPSYDAFRMPIYLPIRSEPGGKPLVVWGNVRPAPVAAHQTHAAQSVKIQFAPGKSAAFKTLSTVTLPANSGYFETSVPFPGAGDVRLAWRYPHGLQVFSRTVTLTG